MNPFLFLFLTTFCVLLDGEAQEKRIVFLTDKNNSPYSIRQPEKFLSERALERRNKRGIPVDLSDLPVNPSYIQKIKQLDGITILASLKWSNAILVESMDESASDQLNKLPFVRSSKPVAKRKKNQDSPSSSYRLSSNVLPSIHYGAAAAQIDMHNGQWLHQNGATGSNTLIAVLDAGFFQYDKNRFLDSLMIRNQITATRDFVSNNDTVTDDHPHGLLCLSILAGNQKGNYVGSCPDARFLLLRTEDAGSEQIIEEYYWGMGAEYADSIGADVISSSVGYSTFDNPSQNHTYSEMDGNTTFITRMADAAAQKGILVVNSAGNEGNSTWKYVGAPADGDSVFAVGAVNQDKQIAAFSSLGPTFDTRIKPDVVSLGINTALIGTDGQIIQANGTSFSTPNIAGLAACLWELFPEIDNGKLIQTLRASSDRFTNPDAQYGYGIPDMKKAAMLLLQENFSAQFNTNACNAQIKWSSKDRAGMRYILERKRENESDFIAIDSVNVLTERWGLSSYKWEDSAPIQNAAYRIRQQLDSAYSFIGDVLKYNTPSSCISGTVQNRLNLNNLRMYPNPAHQSVTITGSLGVVTGKISIQLSDASGRILRQLNDSVFNHEISTATIHISHLSPGLYFLRFAHSGQFIGSKKLIVQ